MYIRRGVDKLRIGVIYALIKKDKNANKLFSLRTRYAIDFRFHSIICFTARIGSHEYWF